MPAMTALGKPEKVRRRRLHVRYSLRCAFAHASPCSLQHVLRSHSVLDCARFTKAMCTHKNARPDIHCTGSIAFGTYTHYSADSVGMVLYVSIGRGLLSAVPTRLMCVTSSRKLGEYASSSS